MMSLIRCKIIPKIQEFKSPLYRNSIYISLSSLTIAITGFLFWAIATRLYPPEDIGVASAIVSAINLIFNLSMLGMNFAIIRFYPEYQERAVSSAVIITSIASIVFSAMYGLLFLMSKTLGISTWKFLAIFVMFSVIGTLYNVMSIYAIARRESKQAFFQSLLFGSRFIFLFFFISIGAVGIVSSFGLGLSLGFGYAVFAIGFPKLSLDISFIRNAFKFSLGNYLASIANMAPSYVMPTLVLGILGKEEAAYFYMAFAIGNLLLFVPNSINTSFFVEGSHGLQSIRATLKKAISISYLYLTIITVTIWFFGRTILRLFGDGYSHGAPLLKLLVLGGFLVVIFNFSITVMNIKKRIREVVILNTIKATLFLGISYILVPRAGITGIGFGWVCSYAGTLLVLGVILRKEL